MTFRQVVVDCGVLPWLNVAAPTGSCLSNDFGKFPHDVSYCVGIAAQCNVPHPHAAALRYRPPQSRYERGILGLRCAM
jgi:hypothetical protein